MHISLPISVLAMLFVVIGAVALRSPPRPEPAQVIVTLSAAWRTLKAMGRQRTDATGTLLTVRQVIEAFAAGRAQGIGPPAGRGG